MLNGMPKDSNEELDSIIASLQNDKLDSEESIDSKDKKEKTDEKSDKKNDYDDYTDTTNIKDDIEIPEEAYFD